MKRRVKGMFGIIWEDECVGVVLRSGTVNQCGHFCYVDISVNGKKVAACGAEDRIYPWHSVKWEDIGSCQPKDMIPALGFCKDGNGYALYHEGKIVERSGHQSFVEIEEDKWQDDWYLCGVPRHFMRVNGRLLSNEGLQRRQLTDEHIQYLDGRASSLQQVLDALMEGLKHSTRLVVSAGHIDGQGCYLYVRRGIGKPRPFLLVDDEKPELRSYLAKFIIATMTGTADWMNDMGLCPVCGESVTVAVLGTVDGRLIGSCGDAFPIYDWVSQGERDPEPYDFESVEETHLRAGGTVGVVRMACGLEVPTSADGITLTTVEPAKVTCTSCVTSEYWTREAGELQRMANNRRINKRKDNG